MQSIVLSSLDLSRHCPLILSVGSHKDAFESLLLSLFLSLRSMLFEKGRGSACTQSCSLQWFVACDSFEFFTSFFVTYCNLTRSGPPKETVKRQRRDHLNRGLAILYKEPIQLVQGKGQYLWDESGKQYLDCFAGVATVSVGHAHEKINQAAFEQMGKIGHSTPLYLNEQMTQYAEELAARYLRRLGYPPLCADSQTSSPPLSLPLCQ